MTEAGNEMGRIQRQRRASRVLEGGARLDFKRWTGNGSGPSVFLVVSAPLLGTLACRELREKGKSGSPEGH